MIVSSKVAFADFKAETSDAVEDFSDSANKWIDLALIYQGDLISFSIHVIHREISEAVPSYLSLWHLMYEPLVLPVSLVFLRSIIP